MKHELISEIQMQMKPFLNQTQYMNLTRVLKNVFIGTEVVYNNAICDETDNRQMLDAFISAKTLEGCSENTINYYKLTLDKMFAEIDKRVDNIQTDDLRAYLTEYWEKNNSSKTTIDNIRRILSSFFHGLKMRDIY